MKGNEMANRNFNRFQALEKEVKALYADVAIGATGAPTLTKGLGIASIVRDSAGTYTVTLADAYTRLMFANVVQIVSGGAEDLDFQLDSEDVDGAKTVTIVAHAAGTETDPSDGSRLLIKLEVKNSSVGE
jgi:hypothetical protein